MSEPTDIIVYSKPNCVQCNATYRRLDARGVAYQVIDVTRDDRALERIKAMGYLQAPVVLTGGGEHWSGYNPDRIDALLAH